MSLISDELGQASTKKKEFLGIMVKLIPWSEWVGIVQPHYDRMGRKNVMEVKFYDTVNDELLKFAVVISQSNGKWVLCKHKERDTYEVPGGHREAGEDIFETARRELQEETGAIKFEIKPICVYSVTGKTIVNDTGEETFGLLCFAEITEFAKELHSEMEKVVLMNELPENWTYPLIQPKLIEKYFTKKSAAISPTTWN